MAFFSASKEEARLLSSAWSSKAISSSYRTAARPDLARSSSAAQRFSLSAVRTLCFLSFSSSLARERMPLFFAALPPVMEPPAFISWPSRVTMRSLPPLFLDMRTASASVSATTVRPRRLAKICSYASLNFTSS